MKNNFETVWGRIREETGIKSLQSLADILKKTQPAISKAKAKGEFPPGWAYLVAKEFGLLTEWILTGEGQKRPGKIEINPLLVDVNEWLNEGNKHKDAEFCSLFKSQMVRAFFDYEKWIQKREEKEGGGNKFPASKVA